MKDTSFIINSAMARGLDVVGDRWVLLILRDAFLGRTRFEELRKSTGASRTTLTRRLESLLAEDVMYKRNYSVTGNRFEYKLTQKGWGLYPTSLLALQWETQWTDISSGVLPPELIHASCGQVLNPSTICKNCQQPLEIGDVEWPELGEALEHQLDEIQSFNKRRVRSATISDQHELPLSHVSDLIGDRWTLLLLISAFFGITRYDAFSKQLKIASNILSDRLNLLVDVGIFSRQHYQENPPRSEYLLTPKGKSLYSLVMAMRQWVLDWLPKSEQGEMLKHKHCGKKLLVEVVCGECEHPPMPREVLIKKNKKG